MKCTVQASSQVPPNAQACSRTIADIGPDPTMVVHRSPSSLKSFSPSPSLSNTRKEGVALQGVCFSCCQTRTCILALSGVIACASVRARLVCPAAARKLDLRLTAPANSCLCLPAGQPVVGWPLTTRRAVASSPPRLAPGHC